MKLTPDQIRQIPALVNGGKSWVEIAREYQCSERTIAYWIARHRKEGHEIISKRGAKPIQL